MELQKIYIKTAKGQEEIQHRTCHLAASLRKLLIMVDGHSTADQMAERLASMGNIIPSLAQLETEGFISPRSPDNAAPSLPNRPPAAQLSSQVLPAAALPTDTHPSPLARSTEDSHSEGMLIASVWDADTRPPAPEQPAFNLDKAKGFTRAILLSALGPSAEYRIGRIEAANTVEALRVELDAIRDALPKLLGHQAESVWKQLEPAMLPLAVPPSTVAAPAFNFDKAKGLIRFTLLGAMGPSAARRIERVEAAKTLEALRSELESIHEMLPKVLSKRQAEQVWKQLEPIIFSIALPP